MVRILLWLIALLFFGTYRIPGPSVFPENRSDPVPDDGDVYIAPAFGEDSSCMQSVGEACFPVFVLNFPSSIKAFSNKGKDGDMEMVFEILDKF